jgi:hypothetical protein
VTKIFWALSKFKNWPRPSVSLSPKSALNSRLQITNSLLSGEVKVGICHSETGPGRKFEIDPSSEPLSEKPLSSPVPIHKLAIGEGGQSTKTPLQEGSRVAILMWLPKLFVYEKSALTPILTKKFKNAGGGIGGLSQKFFRHFQNSKIGETLRNPTIRNPLSAPIPNHKLDIE